MSNLKKNYAIIGGYGRLAVPLDIIDKLCDHAYLVDEEYNSSAQKLQVSDVRRIEDFRVLHKDEFSACVVQQKLSNS